MDSALILVLLSSILTVIGFLFYIRDTKKGKTKPRIISWAIWGALNGISSAAAFFEAQYPTAILMFCLLLGAIAVVWAGWKRGNKDFNKLDFVCLIGAVAGIILWAIFDSPAIAVILMIAVDFIGGIPTQVHSWKKPYEETLSNYVLSVFGAILTLFAVRSWRVTAFAYPLFIVIITLEFILVIIFRRRFLKLKKH